MSEKKGFLSGLFGKKKSGGCCNMEIVAESDTEEQTPSCACSGEDSALETSMQDCCRGTESGICCIKVFGTECAACHEQLENVKAAVKAMGLSMEVEYITDLQKVMGYGVMRTPAIVVNEKVISVGKVLKAKNVQKLLQQCLEEGIE